MHLDSMINGYARVSTDAQDLSSQMAQLKTAGCDKIYREKISGATAEQPKLKKLMAKLSAGDVVIVPAIDRLSRDTTDLLVIAWDMQLARAGLRSLGSLSLIPRPTSPSWSWLCWVSPPSSNAAASWNARRAGVQTPRPRA